MKNTFLALAVILLSTSALADPPERVGRLSYMEGNVFFNNTGGQGQWGAATLNYPVTTGNSVGTDPGAKSEIQIGSMEIRMDQATELDVVNLDEYSTKVKVPQGTINVHIHMPPATPVEVITPLGEVDLAAVGSYHIDAGHPENTAHAVTATVLEGSAQFKGAQSVVNIMQGESAVVSENPSSVTLAEGNSTAFDNWALTREQRGQIQPAVTYVSPELTGYSDLDTYGRWVPTSTYGVVWYPTTVPAGWVPYRYGHWVYVAPWGWTWVDNAPWGFAPFHYGRWAYINDHWGWCPGDRVPHPVYSPAMVTFMDGVRANAEPIGWVPLAPHEVFHPYYHASDNYIRSVNLTNVNGAVINSVAITHNNTRADQFTNRHAETFVPASTFAHGGQVHQAFIRRDKDEQAKAQVIASPNVQPLASKPAEVHPVTHFNHPFEYRPFAVERHEKHQEGGIATQSNGLPKTVAPTAPNIAEHHEERRVNNPVMPVTTQLPVMQVQHPDQHTQIRPTSRGWIRESGQEQRHEDRHEQRQGGGVRTEQGLPQQHQGHHQDGIRTDQIPQR